ncbi:MAG: 50S ribosomal protein L10 [Nanoarchaeota archaeon]
MKINREKPIPKRKIREVKELKELAGTKRTILIASIKNLPDSQFQAIKKKLRGKAEIKVPKKNIILRALNSVGKENINKLSKKIDADCAIIFSDLEAYELAGELLKNKSSIKAKSGQESPEDIEISEGPTELVPGPAISELGALGIQIKIEGGKIIIKTPKIIAKKGEKISQGAADIMNKLGIKPFSIGFVPLVAIDNKEEKIYTNIKIDREATLKELKKAFGRALPFAVNSGYVSEDTIKFLITKAGRHEKALSKLMIKEGINNE